MRIISAITTCPRDGVSYLGDTVESLVAAGFDPQIVADRERSGSWPTLRSALGGLVERFTSPDDCLVVFQDDMEVAAGLAEWVRCNLWPDDYQKIGVVSLYCCFTNLQPQDGWTDLDSIPVWRPHGALALCFPRRSAEIILKDYTNAGFMSGSDTSIASTCCKHGLRFVFHSPGFCEHRGTISAIHPREIPLDKNRLAGRWIDDAKTMSVRENVPDG